MIISIVKRTSFHIAIQIKNAYLAATILPKGVNLKLMYAMKKWVRISTDGRVL